MKRTEIILALLKYKNSLERFNRLTNMSDKELEREYLKLNS